VAEAAFSYVSSADGREIAARRWTVEGRPRAQAQIAHGLAEHCGRYRRLAEALNAVGIVAYANDHRGHGRSMRAGEAAGDFGEAGWHGLVSDMADLNRRMAEEAPSLPRVLIGHSMGSFAAQTFLLDHGSRIDACVLSGSSDLPTVAQFAAAGADVSFAAFNMAFEPARTPFDWLSRDEAEVDAYIVDPLCGFDAPPATAAALVGAAARIGDPAAMAKIPSELPILIASGDMDPVGGNGALLPILEQRLRDAGLTDVTLKLYPGARHEIFNETNRDEVTADVVAWIVDRLGLA